MYIKFKNVYDLEYFISINADHQNWLSWYNCKRVTINILYIDDNFMNLINYKSGGISISDADCARNREIIFSYKYEGRSFYENVSFSSDM